jgi:hypothetical protein
MGDTQHADLISILIFLLRKGIFFYLVGWDLGPFVGPLGSYKPQYCGHILAYCTFSPNDT